MAQARATGSEVLGQSASAAGLQSASFSIKSLMSDAFGASLEAHTLSPVFCLCLGECVSRLRIHSTCQYKPQSGTLVVEL